MSPGAPPAPAPAPAPPPDRAPARGPNFVEDTLTDALASQLAHTTLAPPAPPAPASPRRPSRPRRRSSLSEFRFPVGVEQSGSGQSSAARGGAVGSPRPRQGQGQGQGMGGSESVSSGLAGGWTDERAAHPFAGSAQLLRRCVSDEDLGNGGEDDDAADDSGFDSDVSLRLVTASSLFQDARTDSSPAYHSPGALAGRAVPHAAAVDRELDHIEEVLGTRPTPSHQAQGAHLLS